MPQNNFESATSARWPPLQPSESTFRVVAVNVNKRSVSADARAFIPNYLLGVDLDLFNSKRSVEG